MEAVGGIRVVDVRQVDCWEDIEIGVRLLGRVYLPAW